MKFCFRHAGFRVFAIIAAVPVAFCATLAAAETPAGAVARATTPSPYANAVAPEDMAGLRGGNSVSSLPAVRLWDEVGGRGQTRTAPQGAVSLNGGSITIRVGR